MGRLEGKRAFVTAAGAGIGQAIAKAFAAEGARVVATDINARALEPLQDAGIAEVKKLDVRDTLAVNAIARDHEPFDILCNAAGFVHQGTLLECSDKDWEFSFDLNVTSIHRMLSAFLPRMLENGGGSIVNIASVSGPKGIPNRYVYGATKAAVIGLTKSVAADFITQGIRCNAICPGTVDTPSLGERIVALSKETGQSEKAVREAFVARQPMGRLGTAEEIGALAVYLGSDESVFMTGQALAIDGGLTV